MRGCGCTFGTCPHTVFWDGCISELGRELRTRKQAEDVNENHAGAQTGSQGGSPSPEQHALDNFPRQARTGRVEEKTRDSASQSCDSLRPDYS